MNIGQNRPWPEMHTCYNCDEKGHISTHYSNPWKQRTQSAMTKINIKSLVAEAVAVVLDAWEVVNKAEKAKEEF